MSLKARLQLILNKRLISWPELKWIIFSSTILEKVFALDLYLFILDLLLQLVLLTLSLKIKWVDVSFKNVKLIVDLTEIFLLFGLLQRREINLIL